MRCCSFKFQVLIVMLQHSKQHELTRARPEQGSWPNFDVFHHFSIMKVAETFCGCGYPPSSATCQRWHPLDQKERQQKEQQ